MVPKHIQTNKVFPVFEKDIKNEKRKNMKFNIENVFLLLKNIF